MKTMYSSYLMNKYASMRYNRNIAVVANMLLKQADLSKDTKDNLIDMGLAGAGIGVGGHIGANWSEARYLKSSPDVRRYNKFTKPLRQLVVPYETLEKWAPGTELDQRKQELLGKVLKGASRSRWPGYLAGAAALGGAGYFGRRVYKSITGK